MLLYICAIVYKCVRLQGVLQINCYE